MMEIRLTWLISERSTVLTATNSLPYSSLILEAVPVHWVLIVRKCQFFLTHSDAVHGPNDARLNSVT
jgi:hypothetical protein